MPTLQAPAGGQIANNLYVRGGRFLPKPLSRVATVMRKLRNRVSLARAAGGTHPLLLPHEEVAAAKTKQATRDQIERLVDNATEGLSRKRVSRHSVTSETLPTLREVKALAEVGSPVRGSYEDAGRVVHDLFPHPGDVERWAAANGILSANAGWVHHTAAATLAHALWVQHGRPTNAAALHHLFGERSPVFLVHGGTMLSKNKRKKLIALYSHPDPYVFDAKQVAGSFKTPNFAAAHFDERGTPIDRHMGRLLSPASRRATEAVEADPHGWAAVRSVMRKWQETMAASKPVHLAYKRLLGEAASQLGWEPRQVQEAVWVGVLSLMAAKKRLERREHDTTDYGSLMSALTKRAVRAGWDIHTVFRDPVFRHAVSLIPDGEKWLQAAAGVSRGNHPLPEEASPASSDPEAVESAARRLPAHVAGGAVPIARELRRIGLSRVAPPVHSSALSALLHLALLAAE